MNSKTAKLLKRVATKEKCSFRDLKRQWRNTPRDEKSKFREKLRQRAGIKRESKETSVLSWVKISIDE